MVRLGTGRDPRRWHHCRCLHDQLGRIGAARAGELPVQRGHRGRRQADGEDLRHQGQGAAPEGRDPNDGPVRAVRQTRGRILSVVRPGRDEHRRRGGGVPEPVGQHCHQPLLLSGVHLWYRRKPEGRDVVPRQPDLGLVHDRQAARSDPVRKRSPRFVPSP
uniref:(northern house mosquito) hypothetical protein n=1 Tax=Culex pipiens TaxID=7175 RepID=A0A8D8ADK3_CULPI